MNVAEAKECRRLIGMILVKAGFGRGSSDAVQSPWRGGRSPLCTIGGLTNRG